MTHEVVQCQFLGWPDRAKAGKKAARSMMPLIADVKKEIDAGSEFGVLAHCMLVCVEIYQNIHKIMCKVIGKLFLHYVMCLPLTYTMGNATNTK